MGRLSGFLVSDKRRLRQTECAGYLELRSDDVRDIPNRDHADIVALKQGYRCTMGLFGNAPMFMSDVDRLEDGNG
jgi:hypothetical protein